MFFLMHSGHSTATHSWMSSVEFVSNIPALLGEQQANNSDPALSTDDTDEIVNVDVNDGDRWDGGLEDGIELEVLAVGIVDVGDTDDSV